MNDNETEATPNTLLGFRIAVGAVGLLILIVFILLGSVALKQSATTQALEDRKPMSESAVTVPTQD